MKLKATNPKLSVIKHGANHEKLSDQSAYKIKPYIGHNSSHNLASFRRHSNTQEYYRELEKIVNDLESEGVRLDVSETGRIKSYDIPAKAANNEAEGGASGVFMDIANNFMNRDHEFHLSLYQKRIEEG